MIKLTTKKGTIKATLRGEAKDVAAEIAHTAVGLVEHLIGVDKACGYACGRTIIEVLQKMIPEQKKKEEPEKDGE